MNFCRPVQGARCLSPYCTYFLPNTENTCLLTKVSWAHNVLRLRLVVLKYTWMVNNLTAALLCSHILYFNIVHIPFKWSLLTYIDVSFYQIIEKNEIVQETWSTETIVISSGHIQIKFKLLFWSAKSRFYYYNIFWSLRQTDSHTYKKEIKWGKRKK